MGTLFNRELQTPLRQQLRNRMTHAEKILWYYLRKEYIDGYKFRRQYGIGPYVVDFYCDPAKLAIEVDGDSHYQAGAGDHDAARQRFIEQRGIRVIRVTDNEVRDSIAGVVEKIRQHLTPSDSPSERGRKLRTPSTSPLKRGRSDPISSPYQGEDRRGLSERGGK
ncbi:endonuclease domain-containing protein [Candidatus Uhrbacteria bacterium]|nr:endonuclease domain-containing protein [Candidatus Uhrbacteria bacterium]